MIFIFCFHADDADAAAVLSLIGVRRNAFDVSGVGDRDDAGVTRDEVGDIDVAFIECDFCAARIGVFVLDFLKFLLDDSDPEVAGSEEAAEIVREFHLFIVFVLEILDGQSGELIEAHVEDFRDLNLGESVPGDEGVLRFLTRAGGADDADDIVEVADREEQTFQNVDARFDFRELKTGSAGDDFKAVVDVTLENLKQVQGSRAVHVDDEHVAADRFFHLRMGVELIEDDGRHGAALDVDDDADAGLVAGFVAQTGDAGNLFVADEVGDAFDEHFLVDRIRNFGDEDLLAAVFRFEDLRFCADLDDAVAGIVETADRIDAVNDAARREVRTGDELHQIGDGCGRMIQKMESSVDDFAEVVRRNVGRHADADACAAVDEKIREFRGQNFGFAFAFIEVRNHVDGIFVEIGKQFFREALHAAFGITGGRGGVAVDGSEVALAFNQRGAHGEVLGETHKRIVNRGVSVRMILTHDFTDDSRRFHGGVTFGESKLFHSVEDSAVDGLKTVTDVRNRTSHVDAQGILQVRSMHNILNMNRIILHRNAGYIC